jgi:hypothetical protein
MFNRPRREYIRANRMIEQLLTNISNFSMREVQSNGEQNNHTVWTITNNNGDISYSMVSTNTNANVQEEKELQPPSELAEFSRIYNLFNRDVPRINRLERETELINSLDSLRNRPSLLDMLNQLTTFIPNASRDISTDFLVGQFLNEPMTEEKKEYIMNMSGQSLLYKDLSSELKINNNKNCPVCSEEFNENTKIFSTTCLHIFCYSCLETWICKEFKQTCPMCRMQLIE